MSIRNMVLVLVLMALAWPCAGVAAPSGSPVKDALENILILQRPKQLGFATIWDGNKYVQCGLTDEGGFRCEAAGARMQPSLRHVLTAEKLARLQALGWREGPKFGNLVQVFPPGASLDEIASKLTQTLAEGYDAHIDNLEVATEWVADEPCPPRNGPSQNLAGMINDAPAMASTAVHACGYPPTPDPETVANTNEALFARYGLRISGEIQRLRVNADGAQPIFAIFDTGIGYIQCQPETAPKSIYCEAQSADSWPALASVLTPERLAKLHALGFIDPGRAPNYSKTYPVDQTSDVAIAAEVLTILHDVYGYTGASALEITTEHDKTKSDP
jgi:hypothetical protein